MSKVKKTSLIIFLLLLCISGMIAVFLCQGKTTTTGNYPDNISDEALSCSMNNVDYPFFAYDYSTKKETTVKMLFAKNTIKSISLTHNLYYDDAQKISGSESYNHGVMNLSFASNGLEHDALNAKYASLSDRMQFTLYATSSDLNATTLKYFLIDTGEIFTEKTQFQNFYQGKGFSCE